MSLTGKIAIVTGASRGIGAGIAFELAKHGAKVALTYTTPGSKPGVEAVISRITALQNGSSASAIQADLRDPDAPRRIIAATLDAFPTKDNKLDIVINNAGVALCKPLTECSDEDISSIFDVNVTGTMRFTREVIPYLRSPGRIINISSIAARRGAAGFSIYSASKAALEGFTRSLAYELGVEGQGHTVNCVQPGPVESSMLRNDLPPDVVEYMRQGTAVGNRIGMPEDIARVVVFLAGEESGWVSGECISVSGGFHMN
ncbi:hypothetical protein ASPCAL05058 [Aspergillus calidoustus]|uniref:Ketoreductase domain-containing protein n=1 Tax=Aspergillus calidoustus TaxID=454130 RepID=A0A0U5FWJ4_ASPCI|nr:hypothetical protein ASPCAL05058 [Aspergillus calidoustus]